MANKEKEKIKKYEFTINDIGDGYPMSIDFTCNQELKETEKVNYEMIFIKSMYQIGTIMRDKMEEFGASDRELDDIQRLGGARVYFTILMDNMLKKEDAKYIQRNKAELICNQIKRKGYEFTFVLSESLRTKLDM